MDEELKKRWVEALGSGKYKQGFGQLRDEDLFCCLGVLADIAEPGGWTGDLDRPHRNAGRLRATSSADEGQLRAGAYGLSRRTQGSLASRNDAGDTFPQIADYIEKRIKSS